MTVATLDQLIEQVGRVRQEPGLPHAEGSKQSREDLQAALREVRAALVSATATAPDSAFSAQPNDSDGNEVWSVGEIIGHCNQAAVGISGSALNLIGIESGDPAEPLAGSLESRVMSRDEALGAAKALDYDELFARIPEDANLDATETHNFFGTMSARSWLYFMAMHESDHVQQIRSFSV